MADSRKHLTITVDDRPAVVRSKRGTTVGTSLPASKSGCISTPPATPERSKKRVRFSDPRPETELESVSASSGLTPFIRRTTLFSSAPPAAHHIPPTTLRNRGDYGIPISGTIQFEPLRQMLDGRVKRRLRRHRLSEEANNIELETRREVKLLRTEVERLKSQLEARCAEIQSIRDMEDLGDQEEPGNPIAELTARVQELELQVAGLKAELHQKEVESGIEVADLFEDDGRVITNSNLQETHVHDDTINSPTRLDTSFPSPPPTMPNTPCPHSSTVNARAPSLILNTDSPNEVLNIQLQSELELKEIGLANHTPRTAQSSIIRPRKEKVDMETHVVGVRERRQGTRWMSILVPFSTPNALD